MQIDSVYVSFIGVSKLKNVFREAFRFKREILNWVIAVEIWVLEVFRGIVRTVLKFSGFAWYFWVEFVMIFICS